MISESTILVRRVPGPVKTGSWAREKEATAARKALSGHAETGGRMEK